MIKKTLLWIWLTLLWLINFSNAWITIPVWLVSYHSTIDSNYDNTFLKGWAFLTNYLWQWRWILALRNNVLVRRTQNWFPYFYLQANSHNNLQQWFPDRFFACDEITWEVATMPWNCTLWETWNFSWGNKDITDIFITFFKNVQKDDYVYYDYVDYRYVGATWDYVQNFMHICWSSKTIWKSLCFKVGRDTWYWNGWNLINSQNLSDMTFARLQDSRIWYAPWQNWYNWSRDNIENNTNTNTNNNYVCPTIRQVMQNMWENYNTWLCYNNTTYFNWTNFEQIDKEDIFTIFNDDYQNYINRISIYRNNCTNANTTQACQNAFSGEYKKYSIISNAINSNVDEKKLRNYCNLWLNYDPNATTCVASWWWIKEEYTTEEKINDIINNWVIPTPDTNQQTTGENQNNVLNALNKCENWDRECYVNNRNFIDSLKNIYWKITWLFKERNGVNWIIPNYILRITFLTILFTVIFKK